MTPHHDNHEHTESLEEFFAKGSGNHALKDTPRSTATGCTGDSDSGKSVCNPREEDCHAATPEERRDLRPPGLGLKAIHELKERQDDDKRDQAHDR